MSCPDENAIVAYLDDRVGHPEIGQHTFDCDECRVLLDVLHPSQAMGRYQVLEAIGVGASSVVYAADDPELKRRVALKVLHAGVATTAEERLIRSEAQAIARVEHPNVVKVYDVGVHEGRIFIVMELLRGRSLKEWLRERPRTTREILHAFCQAGEGLGAVHAAKLLHRDFKPENVVMEETRACLTDFGLARDLRASLSNAVVGTPSFMAPEQLRGEAIDPRADVYSFCASLNAALRGRRIPRRVSKVLARGLAPTPDARPAAMHEVLTQVRPSPVPRYAAAALLMVLCMLAGAALLRYQQRCSGAEAVLAGKLGPDLRETIRQRWHGSALGAESTTLLNRFEQAFVATHRTTCETAARNETSERVFDARTQCLNVALASMAARAQALADPDLRPADAATILAAIPDPELCQSANPHGMRRDPEVVALREDVAEVAVLLDSGRENEAMAGALKMESDIAAHDAPGLQAEYALLMGRLFALREAPRALHWSRQAQLMAEMAHDDDTRARALLQHAYVQGYVGELEDADRAIEEADAIIKRLRGDVQLEQLREVMQMKIAQRRDASQDAVLHVERAVALSELRVDANALASLPLHVQQCMMHALNKEGLAAIDLCKLVLARMQALFSDAHPRLWLIYDAMGIAFQDVGDFQAALTAHAQAAKSVAAVYGAESNLLSTPLANMAKDLDGLGRTREALAKVEEAERILLARLGANHPEVKALQSAKKKYSERLGAQRK